MSKQSEAKAAQGYTDESPKCGNCKHRKFDLVLPTWMEEENRGRIANCRKPEYGEQHKKPKNQRCAIGGFAIKAQSWCVKHELQDAKHD